MTSPTAGVDAWTAEQERTAALHRAVYAGDTAAVTALLDAGANINARDRRGFSPLARAVERRRHELTLLLLDRGADPNTRDRRGRTPLYWAAEYGATEVARVLIAHGADPAGGDPARYNLLLTAVRSGRAELASVIADTEVWEWCHHSPGETWKPSARQYFLAALRFAVKEGRVGAVRAFLSGEFDALLFEKSDRNRERSRQRFLGDCLRDAARLGHISVIRVLVEHGADAMAVDINGKTPLAEALAAGRTEAAAALCEMGASYGIHEAIELADLAFVEDAIRRKELDPDWMSGNWISSVEWAGFSPLLRGIERGQVEFVRLLLACGANPNGTGKPGTTPLERAAGLGSRATVEILLEYGVDLFASSPYGHSALSSAAAYRQWNMLEFLLERGAGRWPQDVLNTALERADLKTMRLLLAHGADIRAAEAQRGGLLATPARLGDRVFLRFLIDQGADVNRPGNRGRHLPLAMALGAGRWRTAAFLLEAGADPNASFTLHVAVQSGRGELVKLALDKGADPNAKDKDGRTPLDIALRAERLDFMVALAAAGAT